MGIRELLQQEEAKERQAEAKKKQAEQVKKKQEKWYWKWAITRWKEELKSLPWRIREAGMKTHQYQEKIKKETVAWKSSFWQTATRTWLNIAWNVFDVGWELVMSWLKIATPESAQKKVKETVQAVANMDVVKSWVKNYQEFAKKNPSTALDIWLVTRSSDIIPWWVAIKWWKKVVEWVSKATKFATSPVMDTMSKIKTSLNEKDLYNAWKEKIADIMKEREKAKIQKQETKLDDTIWQVIQADKWERQAAKETFKQIDTEWVKTYTDLEKKITEKKQAIVKQQDELLQKETGLYWLDDTYKNIETVLWNKQVNYVKNAIDDIKKTIDNVWDFEVYNQKVFWKEKTLWDMINKVENNTANLEDLNDLARYYNGEFKNKIYDKKWNPKDNIQAERYETNRKWIKEFVRDFMPNEDLKQLDLDYSNIANTERLIKNVNKQINKLQQKIKKRWIIESTWRYIAKWFDLMSWGLIRWFLTGLLPSNIWNKIFDSIGIENALKWNLKIINKLLKKKDLNIKDLENIKVWKSWVNTNTNDYNLAKQLINDYNTIEELDQLKLDIKDLGHSKEKELLNMLEQKKNWINEINDIKQNEKDFIKDYYGKDLIASYNVIAQRLADIKTTKWHWKFDQIEQLAKTDQWFKNFYDNAKEYIDKMWLEQEKTINDILDDLIDLKWLPKSTIIKKDYRTKAQKNEDRINKINKRIENKHQKL